MAKKKNVTREGISITLGEPTDSMKRPDGKYEFNMTSWYRGPQQRFGKPAEIMVFENDRGIYSEPVGDEGRNFLNFDDLIAGDSRTYVVKVVGEGGPLSNVRRIRIPEEKKENPPEPTLDLEVTGPNKTGDTWELRAVVVALEDKKTLEGQKVQFYLNHAKFGDPGTTDKQGRAIRTFNGLKPGKYLVEAALEGKGLWVKKSAEIPEEKKPDPKPAAKLVSSTVTKGNDNFVYLQVLDQDSKSIKGAVVRLYDPVATGGKVDLTTDENGVASTTLRFGGRKQTYAATVLGTEVNCEFTLYRQQ